MAQIHISPIYEHNLTSQNTFYLQCTYCGSKENCSINNMTKFIYKKFCFAHVCRCHRTHYFDIDEFILLYVTMYTDEQTLIDQIKAVIDPVTKQVRVKVLSDDLIESAHVVFKNYMKFFDTLE